MMSAWMNIEKFALYTVSTLMVAMGAVTLLGGIIKALNV